MAYTEPTDPTTGELITAAWWKTDNGDNIRALRTGAIAIASQAALDFIYASSATQLARLAKGTGLQVPRINAAATGWEFAPVTALLHSFAYSFGNDTTRAVSAAGGTSPGTVTFSEDGALFSTGANTDDFAEMRVPFGGRSASMTGIIFFGTFRVSTQNANFETFFGLYDLAEACMDAAGIRNKRNIGFSVKRTASGAVNLVAIVGDGSALTRSATLTTVAVSDYVDVFFRVVSSTSVDFYYKKNSSAWSSATNIAAGLPAQSGWTAAIRVGISNINAGVAAAQVAAYGAGVHQHVQ